jgi:hypothetical protein
MERTDLKNILPIGLIALFTLFVTHSCFNKKGGNKAQSASKAPSSVEWVQGDCIDKALSPYIYQIAQIEGSTVYLYKMGVMGKKVIQKNLSELKEGKDPFSKVPCP